jgi:hypothetical protein
MPCEDAVFKALSWSRAGVLNQTLGLQHLDLGLPSLLNHEKMPFSCVSHTSCYFVIAAQANTTGNTVSSLGPKTDPVFYTWDNEAAYFDI